MGSVAAPVKQKQKGGAKELRSLGPHFWKELINPDLSAALTRRGTARHVESGMGVAGLPLKMLRLIKSSH